MSDPGDTFTEVTSRSWISRIGQSIVGVLIGLVMVIASIVVLFWNEGRAIQTARSLAEGAGLVVDVDSARVDPGNEGKLVHISGDLTAPGRLSDAEFGVTAKGLRLVRAVEMYQWKEETKTETHRVWSDTRHDSSRFRHPDGHENPTMRYHRVDVIARDATPGAFHPGEQVLRLLPADERLSVDPAMVGSSTRPGGSPVQVVDGDLYLGNDPSNPRIGDLRISYRLAPNGNASIIGRQTGTDLTEYQAKAGDQLLMATPGVASAAQMFKAANDENRMLTWVLRFVGAVLMFIGFALILRPLVVVADVVPFIGNILGAGVALVALGLTAVLAPAIIAIAWFAHRPLLSIAVIAIGLIVAFGVRTLATRRVQTASTAQKAET
jgi:Transmembrane protein 43